MLCTIQPKIMSVNHASSFDSAICFFLKQARFQEPWVQTTVIPIMTHVLTCPTANKALVKQAQDYRQSHCFNALYMVLSLQTNPPSDRALIQRCLKTLDGWNMLSSRMSMLDRQAICSWWKLSSEGQRREAIMSGFKALGEGSFSRARDYLKDLMTDQETLLIEQVAVEIKASRVEKFQKKEGYL